MGEYTIPSSVAIDSQHQVLVCTHSHKQNETKQNKKQTKRNLYTIFWMHVTQLLRKGHIHRSLAQNSPCSVLTLLHLGSPCSTCTSGKEGRGGGTLTLLVECPPYPPNLKRIKLKGEKKGGGVWKAGSWPEAYKVLKAIGNYVENL